MLQTITRPVAAAPVVSLVAACTFCPVVTSFSCLNCGTAMCADCCPGDYCPDCSPAPVAPALDWQTERYGYVADVAIVACAGCDAPVGNPDDSADVFCPRCTLPTVERLAPYRPAPVACLLCGQPIYTGDADSGGTRHARCGRFLARLDARRAAWEGDAIAA